MDYGLLAKTIVVDLASLLVPSWLKPSKTAPPPPPPRPPIIPFPQFNKLPVELRLKIWEFSIEPRVVPVHLYTSSSQEDEDVLNDEEEMESRPTAPENLPPSRAPPMHFDSYTYGNELENPSGKRMAVTTCRNPMAHERCECSTYSIGGRHFHNLPPQAIVCRESREVIQAMDTYKKYFFSHTYNTNGLHQDVYDPEHLFSPQADPTLLPKTDRGTSARGVILNPSIDILYLRARVSSRSRIQEVCHFSTIVAREAPEISKVVIDLGIAMPPYKFLAKDRFEYWKAWGESAWWVPVGSLLRLKGLKEVVLVTHGDGEGKRKWLPEEWKVRTEGLWRDKLLRYVEFWPGEWEGVMPVMRFVERFEEA